MRVARLTVVGGVALIVTPAVASPIPYIPRSLFLKALRDVIASRVHIANVNAPTNGVAAAAPQIDTTNQTAVVPGVDASASKTHKSSPFAWLDDNLFGKITVTGSRTVGLHSYSVTGDQSAFQSLNANGQGGQTFTDQGSTNIAGKNVLGILTFQMNVQDQQYSDPTNNVMTLEYDKGPFKVSEGDIRGSLLNTNSLTTFAKTLKGSQIEYKAGPLHLKALYSETKGSPRTLAIQGSNSMGPYYLQSGKIQNDSLDVQVDGQPMKLGTDYTADTQSGTITFMQRIIPPTSTIVVTYEAISPNSVPGILDGVAGSYDLGKYGLFGFTAVQIRGTGISSDGTITDPFQYYETPGVASSYLLSYEPQVSTVQVEVGTRQLFLGQYVNGQVLGDYALNPVEPRQLLINPDIVADPGATLYVRYAPVSVQTVDGDRQVLGFDYKLPLGNRGYVQYDEAIGQTIDTANGSSGIAKTISSEYKLGSVDLTATIKDIPSGYVAIESQSFNRNEDSYTLGAQTKQNRFTYGVSYSNSSVDELESAVPGLSTTGTTTTGTTSSTAGTASEDTYINARSTVAKAFASYLSPDGTTWSVTQSRTAGHLLYDSQVDTTGFTGSHTFGKLKLGTGVDIQQAEGPLTNSAGNVQMGSIDLQTYHLDATYAPINKLSLTGRASISDVRALGQSTQGNDLSLSSDWNPNQRWRVSAMVLHSNSGQTASLASFSNGTGYGYGTGNGFSSGPTGDGLLGGTNSTLDEMGVTTQYQATKRLALTTQLNQNEATGTLASNTLVKVIGVGANWDLGKFNMLDFNLDHSISNFVGADTSTTAGVATTATANSLNLTFAGTPKGPWSYRLSLSSLINGGTSSYQQNSLNYDASLAYRLAKRQTVAFSYVSGSYTGYAGQLDRQIVASYRYNLFQNFDLVGSYSVHQVSNLDPTITTGAYRAAGFDLQLSMGLHQ
jgi:hypothetical protein